MLFFIVPSHFHYQMFVFIENDLKNVSGRLQLMFHFRMKKNLVCTMSVEQRMLTINLLLLVAKEIANFNMFRLFFFVCGEKWDNFLSSRINYPSLF